jgi:hypothetical protein
MRALLVMLLSRAQAAARERDDCGVASETVVIAGLVAAALVVVAVVTAFINGQLSVLGG